MYRTIGHVPLARMGTVQRKCWAICFALNLRRGPRVQLKYIILLLFILFYATTNYMKCMRVFYRNNGRSRVAHDIITYLCSWTSWIGRTCLDGYDDWTCRGEKYDCEIKNGANGSITSWSVQTAAAEKCVRPCVRRLMRKLVVGSYLVASSSRVTGGGAAAATTAVAMACTYGHVCVREGPQTRLRRVCRHVYYCCTFVFVFIVHTIADGSSCFSWGFFNFRYRASRPLPHPPPTWAQYASLTRAHTYVPLWYVITPSAVGRTCVARAKGLSVILSTIL